MQKMCCGCFFGNFFKKWATLNSMIWSHWTRNSRGIVVDAATFA